MKQYKHLAAVLTLLSFGLLSAQAGEREFAFGASLGLAHF